MIATIFDIFTGKPMMVEAGANEVPEDKMLEAILFGHEEIKNICRFIKNIVAEVGKEKQSYKVFKAGEDVDAAVREYATAKMVDAIYTFEKQERMANMDAVAEDTKEHFAEEFEGRMAEVDEVLYNIKKEEVRRRILDEGVRPDDRALNEIRPLWSETGYLPRTTRKRSVSAKRLWHPALHFRRWASPI